MNGMNEHIAILYALDGMQAVLVLIVLLLLIHTIRRVDRMEKTLESIPETLRQHDKELVDRAGREFYKRVSDLMLNRAEEKAYGRRADDLKKEKP